MGRPRRVCIPGVSLHLINRGNNRVAIFDDDFDYEWFLAILRRAAERHGVSVHVLALMTNHFHFIVTPHGELALPKMMQELGTRYVRYYNRNHGRTGTLWNGRYRAIPISDDLYLLTCLRYIEQNPVRAGMVADASAYRWSTYSIHALGTPPGWIVLHDAYLALGSSAKQRQAAYRAMCDQLLSPREIVQVRDHGIGEVLGASAQR